MKDIDLTFAYLVSIIIVIVVGLACLVTDYHEQKDYIKELQQNQIEQAEEKEVYVNKCKMYEDLLKRNGLLDECECR